TRDAIAAPMPRDAPVTSTSRPSSGSVTSPPRVLDVIARCLPEPDFLQATGRDSGRELLPYEDRNVLRRRQPVRKPLDVEIQVAMIQHRVDILVEQRLEDRDIDYVS